MQTIPPEEYYSTSTVDNLPSDDCTSCDISEIDPLPLPTGQGFTSVEKAAAGACKITEITCSRTDNQVCTEVSITGTSGTASSVLASSTGTTVTQATTTLHCEADGTYSSGTTTKIDELSCNFVDCNPPVALCTTCDISTIAPPATTGAMFSSVEQGAAGACKETQVTCERIDGQTCTDISISATATTGSGVLANAAGTKASTTLTCQADGTYSGGAATQISQLTCIYTGCVLPCAACDIRTIAPTATTGAMFSFVEQGAAGACKETQVTCERTDTQVCTSISVLGTTPSGPVTLGSSNTAGTTQATATLTCQADGKYSSGTATQISQLTCNYDCTSSPPCEQCDILSIVPVMPAGTTFNFNKISNTGQCLVYEATCVKDNSQLCAISITAAYGSERPVIIASEAGVSMLTTIVTCQADGTFASGFVTGINALNCVFQCRA